MTTPTDLCSFDEYLDYVQSDQSGEFLSFVDVLTTNPSGTACEQESGVRMVCGEQIRTLLPVPRGGGTVER